MQTFRFGRVRLLTGALVLVGLPSVSGFAAGPKTHSVTLGAAKKVAYTPADSPTPPAKGGDASVLKVRPLMVDGRQKEWTTGDTHDVTDRSFAVRRAMRLNDALPGESPRWNWQPGPWLLVDRSTGHIAALHLPDFDEGVSEVVWYRDYAAYCGTADTAKGGLFAIVAQIGVRRAVVSKQIGKWPQATPVQPVCQPAKWQRMPMRVTMQPTGGEPMTFDVVGAVSLIEEGDPGDAQ